LVAIVQADWNAPGWF
nr:Chain A, lasso peptide [Streptomyces sp.]